MSRSRSRFPKIPGPGLCRGCAKPVPSGRQTWCSNACIQRYHPWNVRKAVEKRDKHICFMCHRDIREMHLEWIEKTPVPAYQRFSTQEQYAFIKKYNLEAWGALYQCPEYLAVAEEEKAHRRLKPREEHDHIIPFSEGGQTVLENLRTLCSPCHKARTKAWHEQRREARKAQKLQETQ